MFALPLLAMQSRHLSFVQLVVAGTREKERGSEVGERVLSVCVWGGSVADSEPAGDREVSFPRCLMV